VGSKTLTQSVNTDFIKSINLYDQVIIIRA